MCGVAYREVLLEVPLLSEVRLFYLFIYFTSIGNPVSNALSVH